MHPTTQPSLHIITARGGAPHSHMLPSLPLGPFIVQYQGVLRSPENQCECKVMPSSATTSLSSPWTCGKDYVLTPAWGWEVWDKEPSPLTGRLHQVRKAARFPLLSKLCQRKRREMDNQTTVHAMYILQTENQGMEVRLKGSQNSNTGLLIPTVVLFPLW